MDTVTSNTFSFGLPGELVVTIPDYPSFYSLYADGSFSRKTYNKDIAASLFAYAPGAPVFLYYTYPTHRAASLVRNTPGNAEFPGLSRRVSVLWTVHASKVDKLKRSVSFLNKHYRGAFCFNDGFYIRLYFILLQRGKLNYIALRKLAEKFYLQEKTLI
jgi:hypothetical protein